MRQKRNKSRGAVEPAEQGKDSLTRSLTVAISKVLAEHRLNSRLRDGSDSVDDRTEIRTGGITVAVAHVDFPQNDPWNGMDEATSAGSSHGETDRESVISRVVEIIGDEAEALRWLGTPVRALDYATPISRLNDADGQAAVIKVLTQLEHGVL